MSKQVFLIESIHGSMSGSTEFPGLRFHLINKPADGPLIYHSNREVLNALKPNDLIIAKRLEGKSPSQWLILVVNGEKVG